MSMSIKEYVKKWKNRRAMKKRLQREWKAEELFQLKEYNGKIWLTFNGNRVCPCDMLKEQPVEAVRQMRELYVEEKN